MATSRPSSQRLVPRTTPRRSCTSTSRRASRGRSAAASRSTAFGVGSLLRAGRPRARDRPDGLPSPTRRWAPGRRRTRRSRGRSRARSACASRPGSRATSPPRAPRALRRRDEARARGFAEHLREHRDEAVGHGAAGAHDGDGARPRIGRGGRGGLSCAMRRASVTVRSATRRALGAEMVEVGGGSAARGCRAWRARSRCVCRPSGTRSRRSAGRRRSLPRRAPPVQSHRESSPRRRRRGHRRARPVGPAPRRASGRASRIRRARRARAAGSRSERNSRASRPCSGESGFMRGRGDGRGPRRRL